MYFLATKIFETKDILNKKDPAFLSILKENHYDIVKRVVKENGKIIIEEPSGVIVQFEDPVIAVICAIKIQKLHKNGKKQLTPQISSVLFKNKDLINNELGISLIEKIRILTEDSGFGEVIISSDISKVWQEHGNRKIKSISRKKIVRGEEIELFLIKWDSSTFEPLFIRRRRGAIFVVLILFPSLILSLLLIYLNRQTISENSSPIFIAGPVYSLFSKLKCDVIYKNLENQDNFVSICRIKKNNLLNYPNGSKEIFGRLKKESKNYMLTLDLISIPQGILYNRVSMKINNYKGKSLNSAIAKLSGRLIESYVNPVSIDQFKEIFEICNEDRVPKFSFENNNRIKFLRKPKGNKLCLEELIRNLPTKLTGKEN